MKKYLLLFLFSATALFSKAQTADWSWAKTATGANNSTAANVATDVSGNIYVAGTFNSDTITFGATRLTNNNTDGSADMFLVKYDAAGNVLWANSFGGNSDDIPSGITADVFGNLYVTGSFRSSSISFGSGTLTNSTGNADIFTVKYNASGHVLWAKGVGGDGNDVSYSLTTDAAGKLYVAGFFTSSTITFGANVFTNVSTVSGSNIFLAKYDTAGNIIWAKSYGGGDRDYAFGITASKNGNIYLTGSFGSVSLAFGSYTLNALGAFGLNFYVVKYDTAGNVGWATNAGADGSIFATAITADSLGNVYATGYFTSSTLTFGSTTLTNNSIQDMFLVKYDASGNPKWAQNAVTTDEDNVASNAISADNFGNVYTTGDFSTDSITFGSVTLHNSSVGSNDLFIIKHDASGNAQWGQSIGGGGSEYGNGVANDKAGNVYLAGSFSSSSVSFGTNTLDNNGNTTNMYVARYGELATGINTVPANTKQLIIFPNPSSGQFMVQLSGNKTGNLLEVYDVVGRTVYQSSLDNLSANYYRLDLSKQPVGIYFVQVKSGDAIQTEKIIITK